MLVFTNAVAFAVAVPDIATASICCEQYAAGLNEFYYHSEKLPEIRCPYPVLLQNRLMLKNALWSLNRGFNMS